MRRERKQYNKREKKVDGPTRGSKKSCTDNLNLSFNCSSSTASSSSSASSSLISSNPLLPPLKTLSNNSSTSSSVSTSPFQTVPPQQIPILPMHNIDQDLNEYLDKLVSNEEQIEIKLETDLETSGFIKRTLITTNTNEYQQLIVDFIGKECFYLIKWAKTLPYYKNDNNNVNDFAHVIESNFMDLTLFNVVWRTYLFTLPNLTLASNNLMCLQQDCCIYLNRQFKLTRNLCKELDIMPLFETILELVKQFQLLKISNKEFNALKLIILVKSDFGCENTQYLMQLREHAMHCLELAIDINKRDNLDKFPQLNVYNPNRSIRSSLLLLLLIEIKSLALRLSQYILHYHKLLQIELPGMFQMREIRNNLKL